MSKDQDADPQDFFQSRAAEATSSAPSAPLYADWSHASLEITSRPFGFPPEPVVLPKTTVTQCGIVAMCIPSLLQPPHLRGTAPSIHCWTKTSTESTSNPQQEIAKAIVQQYQQCIPGISLAARVNPTTADFKASFERLKTINDKRFLFHYFSYGAADVTPNDIALHSQDKLSFDRYPIESVLNATAPCAVHVIDCDFAGILKATYEAFIGDRADSGNPVDLFAFFACGPREKLPRSPGLPFDLFTSCMTTPARTALLWHSRHYYCFKNGPLRPLEPDFFEKAPASIINEITLILHRLVEAMACEMFPPELFLKVFHSDAALAHFAANFFLAARILSFFGVMPTSIPKMPDLRNHQLWHSFDLRLDVALLQLNSPSSAPSLTYTAFLEQSLQTLRHLMNVSTKDISFPSQLTQIPPVLTTPNMKEEGCEVLSQYIDTSLDAIRQIMYFPIMVPLFQLFPQRIGGDNLYLCMAKILCFMPAARSILASLSHDVFGELIFPLFKLEKPLFPVIVATMVINKNEQLIGEIDKRWSEFTLPLLKHPHPDVRMWTLLFMSCFINSVSDSELAIDPVLELLDDDCPEVRIVALYTLTFLVGKGKDELICEKAANLASDPCPSVRLQLIITINKLPKSEHSEKVFEFLKKDPHPGIHRELSEDPANQISCVFDWFSSYILSPVRKVIENPSLKLSEVQPVTVSLVKPAPAPTAPVTFQKVQAGPTIASAHPITSNFTNTSDNQFMFGTKAGEICSCKWGEQQKPRARQISGTAVCHVKHIFNNGFPLTMASNMDGYLYVIRFSECELDLVSGFKANDTSFSFEVDEFSRKVYTVSGDQPKFVRIYDLVKEKRELELVPKYGPPKVVRQLPALADVIAVCTEKLELFDIRSGAEPVMAFDNIRLEAFDVSVLNQTPTSFALCHTIPTVSVLDARAVEPVRNYSIGPDNLTTLSFAAQPASSSVAIGNNNGIMILNVDTGKKLEFNSISQIFFGSKKVQAVSQCIFHPSKFSLSILQDFTEVMTLMEERG